MNLDQEILEVAMRRQGLSECVERVISMESESALPKGENYLSTIYRITLKVVLGNGRKAKKSLILKVVPQEKAKTELVKSMGVFKAETMMYLTVLREMEMLMEEFGDTNDVLWCRLLHYEPYSSILLEDLKAGGFKMASRQDCLDLDHALLVLRSLGRFHAMSKILEQRGVISKDDYKPYALVSDKNIIKFFMFYGLQKLAKAMEEQWGPEWYDVAQKLKIPCDVLVEKILKVGEVDDTKFNCLSHGDCWSNNMMFKYDWQNQPYTMRFVDYQVPHFTSPIFDLVGVMYLATRRDVRRRSFDLLLKTYVDSLRSSLESYGYLGDLPTLEDFQVEIERVAFFGYLISTAFTFFVCADGTDAFDMEKCLETEGKEGFSEYAFNNARVREMVGDDIKIFANKYL